jgi:hypothetical protein
LIKVTLGVVILSLTVVLGGFPAWGGEAVPLNDVQLDGVYGGNAEEDSSPDMILINTHCTTCTLDISGNQTGNSAILINAVGSTVNAQLNISVNSGSQTNIGFSNVNTTP